jgi:hypothetical protein
VYCIVIDIYLNPTPTSTLFFDILMLIHNHTHKVNNWWLAIGVVQVEMTY